MGARWVDRGVARFGSISFVRHAVGLGLAAGFATWVVAPISAALPAAGTSVEIFDLASGPDLTFDQPGSYASGGAAADVSLSPTPTIHIHQVGLGVTIVQSSYYFRVEGPVDGTPAPIEIDAMISIDANDVFFQRAETWEVNAVVRASAYDRPFEPGVFPVAYVDALAICSPVSATSPGPQSDPLPIATCAAAHQQQQVVLQLNSLTGSDNLVEIQAFAENHRTPASSFDARIIAPVIRFAPGFDSTGYRIVLSDGVGNGAVVPEPGGATLIGGGLFVLVLRRRGCC